jgi:hypothetical protein
MGIDTTSLFAEIVKADERPDGTVDVYGRASTDSIDIDEQIADRDWLKTALPRWMGSWANVREQHGHIAAGVGKELNEKDDGFWLKSHIVDPGSVAKIKAGVLKGYSIGIRGPRIVTDKAARGGRIVGGEIVEISLVDRPANPDCRLTVTKSATPGLIIAPEDFDEKLQLVRVEELVEKSAEVESEKTVKTDPFESAGGVMAQVLHDARHVAAKVTLDPTEPGVAASTQKSTRLPRGVIVVDIDGSHDPTADGALASLSRAHGFDVFDRKTVLPPEGILASLKGVLAITDSALKLLSAPGGATLNAAPALRSAIPGFSDVELGESLKLTAKSADSVALLIDADSASGSIGLQYIAMPDPALVVKAAEPTTVLGLFAAVNLACVNGELHKRDFSTAERKRLAARGAAMSGGGFPIVNVQDLENAIHAIGRAKDPAAAKAHIKTRAKALGRSDLIPDSWKAVEGDLEKTSDNEEMKHDPALLQSVRNGILQLIIAEAQEAIEGEREESDLQALTDALALFLSWWDHETWEGETPAVSEVGSAEKKANLTPANLGGASGNTSSTATSLGGASGNTTSAATSLGEASGNTTSTATSLGGSVGNTDSSATSLGGSISSPGSDAGSLGEVDGVAVPADDGNQPTTTTPSVASNAGSNTLDLAPNGEAGLVCSSCGSTMGASSPNRVASTEKELPKPATPKSPEGDTLKSADTDEVSEKSATADTVKAAIAEATREIRQELVETRARLEQVEKAAVPGGPIRVRTMAQATTSREADELRVKAARLKAAAKTISAQDIRAAYEAQAAEAEDQLRKLLDKTA